MDNINFAGTALNSGQLIPIAQLESCAVKIPAVYDGKALRIPFYNKIYYVAANRIVDAHGHPPSEALQFVLFNYLNRYPVASIPDGKRITFRELTGAGPLVFNFTKNTNKLIASAFTSDMKKLIERSKALNGVCCIGQNGFDVSICFQALPHIPLFLQFNAADDLFPAQCHLLFYESANHYLDMKDLFILGTYLAGNLIAES